MYKRNNFTEEEKQHLAEWKAAIEEHAGWLTSEPTNEICYPLCHPEATKDLIRFNGITADYKNLLYRDEKYAESTRWGGIIAPPLFLATVTGFADMGIPPLRTGKEVEHQIGENYIMNQPIRPGDTFHVLKCGGVVEDITPDGDQPERVLRTIENNKVFNQRDEFVGSYAIQFVVNFVPEDKPWDGVIRNGYEMTPPGGGDSIAMGKVKMTEEYKYTMEEIEAIDRLYANEVRRGKQIRFWEDVNIGDELPYAIMGPITVWDSVSTMATMGIAPLPMMEVRSITPDEVLYNPETNVPHKGIECHLGKELCEMTNFYSTTLIQFTISNFLTRMASNWMGDDGFIRSYKWRKFANTAFGDTVIARGKVCGKRIDEEGRTVVDVDTWMEVNRGYVSNAGPMTIELQSRDKLLYGKDPVLPENIPAYNPNPDGIRAGDRVRVKDRPGYELPYGFKTAGATATVYQEHYSLPGFCYVVFDNDEATGIDHRITLGMRYEWLEKM